MLLTLQDDGVLRVYESVDEAVRDVEALDAEEVFRAVFDDTGAVYAIQWIRPNERGRLVVSNGSYTLVPTNIKDVPGLLKAIREARAVEPEYARERLTQVERLLIGR
jgi:hypothetical protein